MKRLALLPIQDIEIWDLYKLHQSAYWTVDDLDFEKDAQHYNCLTQSEQSFVRHILAFFAISDTLVNNNLLENFANHPENNLETTCFYNFQSMIENVHSEAYSLQIENIINDADTRKRLFESIKYFPSIRKKTEWIEKWTNSNVTFAERLFAFIIVEGIFFSASFCSIYFFKQRGSMPGLTTSNEYIARDEGLHTQFGILLFKRKNKHQLSQQRLETILKEAVNIEKGFVKDSLNAEIIGMNSNLLMQYVEFVSDTIMNNIGYKPIYNTKNPFGFMDQINLQVKTNFFEGTVTNYQKSKNNVNIHDLF